MNLKTDSNGIWITETEQPRVNYPESDYDYAFQIEESSFWFNHRNEIINATIKKFPFTGNFADIGGGNGFQSKYLSAKFPERKIYFVEPSYPDCLNARKRNVDNIYNIFFQDFPFRQSNIGGIGLFDVLEHIEDDAGFLSELGSLVEKGTHIYITVPAYQWLWSDVDDYSEHFRRHDRKSINELAEKCGMNVLFNSKCFFYLPFLTFPLRSIPYRLSGKRNHQSLINREMKNHQTGMLSGKIFDALNRVELSYFAKDKINFGASCIAVFQV